MAAEEEYIDKMHLYPIEYGELMHFETNIPCVEHYKFDEYMVHTVLNGVKKVIWNEHEMSFEAETVMIPPVGTDISVEIDYATTKDPMTCVALDLDEAFVASFYSELKDSFTLNWDRMGLDGTICNSHFYAHNFDLSDRMIGIYKNRLTIDEAALMKLAMRYRLKEFLALLFQTRAANFLIKQNEVPESVPFMQSVQYIKEHYGEPIKVSDLASVACMSESSYFKYFKNHFGCPPMEYIILERIKKAKELLANSDRPVQEIALIAGFNSNEYFHRKFRSIVKKTPLRYRKQFGTVGA